MENKQSDAANESYDHWKKRALEAEAENKRLTNEIHKANKYKKKADAEMKDLKGQLSRFKVEEAHNTPEAIEARRQRELQNMAYNILRGARRK